MTRDELQAGVAQALATVAPEIEATTLDINAPVRDQVDLDSMDFLRFIIALHTRFGIEVPEADYQKCGTLAGAADYLAARLGVPVS